MSNFYLYRLYKDFGWNSYIRGSLRGYERDFWQTYNEQSKKYIYKVHFKAKIIFPIFDYIEFLSDPPYRLKI